MKRILSESDKIKLKTQNCKRYKQPEIAIMHFEGNDVITASLIDGDNVSNFKSNWFGFMNNEGDFLG